MPSKDGGKNKRRKKRTKRRTQKYFKNKIPSPETDEDVALAVKKIQQVVQRKRTLAKMSVSELARRSNLSLFHVLDIEKGKHKDLKITTLLKLCKGLGIKIDELLWDVRDHQIFIPQTPTFGPKPEKLKTKDPFRLFEMYPELHQVQENLSQSGQTEPLPQD
jgi:transcriptional regulator with XRE-family HTH domain